MDALLVSGWRTPLGKVGGYYRHHAPEELAAAVIRHCVLQTSLELALIDDVLLGNTVGPGGNLARVALLEAGLPVSVPGLTIDRQCGSGLEAVSLAARAIMAGQGDVLLAGGVESVSRAPWKLARPEGPRDLPRVLERAAFVPSAMEDLPMGVAAEGIASRYGISREEQDDYALDSHRRALEAASSGFYPSIMVPLKGEQKTDENLHPGINAALLRRLPPAFREAGTITAGNASRDADGAAVILVASRQAAVEHCWQPMGRLVAGTAAGIHPDWPGLGPVAAIERLLARSGLSVDQIGIWEINEAFSVQVLACIRLLGLDRSRVNVWGGAVAYGHPFGATGAVILLHLLHGMRQLGVRYGVAAAGIAGGQGIALLVESI